MPIQREFSRYSDESEFVATFLIPLLAKLGFGVVVNHHGTAEAGMDLVVGEIDRFGHVRYHGLQVKFEPSIGKRAAHGLVDDAIEAFAAEFMHPQIGTRHRISSFLAANAGSVSDEARKLYFAALHPKYGENVKLLDGRDLLALDRSSTARGENVRSVLSGLQLEMRTVPVSLDRMCPRLQAVIDGSGNGVVYPVERLRLVAVAAWLASPVLAADLPVDEIEALHTVGSAFNRSLDEAGSLPVHTVKSIKIPATKAMMMVPNIRKYAAAIELGVAKRLSYLGTSII